MAAVPEGARGSGPMGGSIPLLTGFLLLGRILLHHPLPS